MGNETIPPATGEMPNGTETNTTGEMPTTPGTGETPATTTTPSAGDSASELEQLKAALKKANAESAAHRHKANELDKLKAEIEASKLSESEKLQKQLAALQAEKEQASLQVQELRIGSSIQLQAVQQGIDPTLAGKLIDRSEIEYDDTGNPKNVADLLKALVKQYPTLVSKPGVPQAGGATNPPRSSSSGSQPLSWDTLSKMNAAEYNARRAEIQQWMANNPSRIR
jgi:hypothetical protein